MTPDSLVCPGCRTLAGDRLDLRLLERRGDLLVCECGRRFPIVDGIPIITKDPAFLRSSITSIVERDLAPEVAAALVEDGPDDAPYPHLLDHVSVYLDAHWGDRADPPGDFALAPFVERIAARPRVAAAVELGCSVGRITAELQADVVVAFDLMFAAVRRARHLLSGERVSFARRMIGRHYTSATITPTARAATLLCADALDPPLLPGAFDRVVALNLLDSVAQPRQLLTVIEKLCAPGGEVILSSPYAWQSNVMAEDQRLGGADPAAAVRAILQERFEIEEEADLTWTLRRDARSAVVYRTHYLRARKGT